MAIWTPAVFYWVDYLVFALLLLFSLGIGLFYAFRDRQIKSTSEYLMAGKSMSIAPVTLSLLASFMSAITLLGTSLSIKDEYNTKNSGPVISFSLFLRSSVNFEN